MANDCLVTKLKGTVDNPNLLYFGEFDVTMKIKSSDIETIRDFNVTTANSTWSWESDKDVYNKISTNPSRVNLGRSGTVVGSMQFWVEETTNFKIHPMYNIVRIASHTLYAGQINYDKLMINGDTIILEGHRGGGVYGHFDQTDFTINITDGGYGVQLPLSLNMKYDKVVVPTTTLCSLAWTEANIYEHASNPSYADKFIQENLEQGADICGILNGENIASQLRSIALPQFKKLSISNIELFHNCPNLVSINIHDLTSLGGSFVEAFKDNIRLGYINFGSLPTGLSRIDLLPLLQAWKANGRVSSNFQCWGAAFSVDGALLPTAMVTIVFDANGDWTIQ